MSHHGYSLNTYVSVGLPVLNFMGTSVFSWVLAVHLIWLVNNTSWIQVMFYLCSDHTSGKVLCKPTAPVLALRRWCM